jgi:hypothetical protein
MSKEMREQINKVKNWKQFLNENTNKFESFEYVDRDYDSKVVQVGMFEKITNKDQIKIGNRFICPRTEENQRGIIDVHTMKPILLYKSTELQSEWHIGYQYHKDKIGKSGNPAVAWDLCYLLRDDI